VGKQNSPCSKQKQKTINKHWQCIFNVILVSPNARLRILALSGQPDIDWLCLLTVVVTWPHHHGRCSYTDPIKTIEVVGLHGGRHDTHTTMIHAVQIKVFQEIINWNMTHVLQVPLGQYEPPITPLKLTITHSLLPPTIDSPNITQLVCVNQSPNRS
jgi:hypothetical protein